MEKLKVLLEEMRQLDEGYWKNKRMLKEEIERHVTSLEKVDGEFIDFYYWESGLPLDWIEKQSGIKAQNFKFAIKEKEINIPCSTCGKSTFVIVKTRSEIYGRSALCSECQQEESERKEHKRKQKIAELKATSVRVAVDLKTMPYALYLQTPHWVDTRKNALKKANYTCQKCGIKNVKLFVHHLTYERRGCELPSDLMALCEPCHKGIHGINLPQKETPKLVPKPVRKKREVMTKKPTKKKLKTKKRSS